MRDAYREAIQRELARWPGVRAVFSRRSKHRQVVLNYEERSRFVVYPVTPSDNRCGLRNSIQDVRQALRLLGAIKT